MSNAFTRHLTTPVPQSEPVDSRQVANNAGGYTFTLDDQERLVRFLILGTDKGTYYVSEKDLTKQNIAFLDELIRRDEDLVRRMIYDVSYNGRAYRNSPAIFALAKLLVLGKDKQAVIDIGPDIVRTSTHLTEFIRYVKLLGGWGRSKRRFVQHWYKVKDENKLGYQMVKYRQRNGWTHTDMLRVSHVRVNDSLERFFHRWYKDEQNEIADEAIANLPKIVRGFKYAQEANHKSDLLLVLDDYPNLPWEAIPTQFHREPDVWKKLFYNGQLNGQALIRNITRLARIDAFKDMQFAGDYAARLTDEEMIRRTRLHPINFLNAVVVHQEGQIVRRKNQMIQQIAPDNAKIRNKDWETVPVIVDALNAGFHLAFAHTIPAAKRTLLAVDVSSSMSVNAAFGLDLSAAQVAGAVAMTIAKTEPYYVIKGFASRGTAGYRYWRARDNELVDLNITAAMDLYTAMAKVQSVNFGSTDCALPITWATENKIEVDTFVVVTDNETWSGDIHPHVALREYREKMKIDAKMIVAGVSATDFTIADPTDAGMLDVVGFDAEAPKLITDFSAGRI